MDKKYYVNTYDTISNMNVLIEVSKEIYETLMKSYRKEKYFLDDLKQERYIYDNHNHVVKIIKSREDSFERLTLEHTKEFSDNFSFENQIELQLQIDSALKELSKDEIALINALFYKDLTEREYSLQSGIPQKTINNRKKSILKRLKKLLY